MTDYKATPEQWAQLEDWGIIGSEYSACMLELRDRVEALEAESKQTLNSSQIGSSLVEQVAQTLALMAGGDAHLQQWEEEARAVIFLIANEVENRGDKGLDLDPGETADWLRREVNPTSQEDYEQ